MATHQSGPQTHGQSPAPHTLLEPEALLPGEPQNFSHTCM